MRPRVSAVVLTLNAERHIGACLAGLAWADERLLLDSLSRDRTVELAAAAGARVAERAFDDYARQRQAALALVTGDWVLFVDADERVSAGLAAEVRDAAARNDGLVGYWIARRNYIWGRWIQGGGWWPDPQLRLLRRDRAAYELDRPVHELVQLDGPVGTLRNALVHYNYETVGQFLRKQRSYARLDAGARAARGERATVRKLITQPLRRAWWRHCELGGSRDGLHGLALAALSGLSEADTQRRLLR